jgi:hypothetical protein
VNIDREAVVKEGKEFAKAKVKAITDSLDRLGMPESKELNGLFEDEKSQ